MTDKEILQGIDKLEDGIPFDEIRNGDEWLDIHELFSEIRERIRIWHYPSRGEIPDKDWSKYPLNVSKECFVLTKRGIGTIARWDNDYRTWFENQPHLPVPDVIAWQYFEPPKEEA